MPRWLFVSIAALLALPLSAAAGPLAALESPPDLTVHYDLYTGGLKTIGIDAKAHFQTGHYAITADVHSVGVLDWLFSYHARHEADGQLVAGGVQPELYANSGQWNGGTRRVKLSYGTTGPIAAEVWPPADKEQRETVPTDLWTGTVDPLSLVLAVNRQADADQPCAVTVPVFDGRRRYNLHLTPLGTERLERTSYASYSGVALRCRVVWERVAGESHNPTWQTHRPPLTTVWLARFGRSRLWLPVRLETESGFGHVVGHMAHVGVTGPAHALD